MSEPAFGQWCLVELFGHQQIVGEVSEQTIAGEGFIRVDVPAVEDHPDFTKLYGRGAIYALTPLSEAMARDMIAQRQQAPIAVYDLPRLPQPRGELSSTGIPQPGVCRVCGCTEDKACFAEDEKWSPW